ncbi:MAG: DUF4124 domain-containing protein [Nevskia sp.]|nr:DUF4124 domain-containing protein [Nevskia sp.]
MRWNDSKPRGGLLCAALLFAASALAEGQVYRWVDQTGQVHYGDQPPPTATLINPLPAAAAPAPAAPAADSQAAKQAEECKRRKDQLGVYKTAASVSETDALGNVHQYSPEEKQKLVERTQKYVDDNCGTAMAQQPQ